MHTPRIMPHPTLHTPPTSHPTPTPHLPHTPPAPHPTHLTQDKQDDTKLGLKSTALTFGDKTKPIITGFALATTAGLVAAGHAAELSWPFYAATTAGAG